MKRFLLNVCLAVGLFLLLDLSLVFVRVACSQRKVKAAFNVSEGTEVLFIGNSHTGCTFAEAPEFRDVVVWRSSLGFLFHYVRFLEFERRGALDRGIKAVVMDCDSSSLGGWRRERVKKDFKETYLFSWRYLPLMPMSTVDLVLTVMLSPTGKLKLRERPPDDTIDWAARVREWTKKDFARHFEKQPPTLTLMAKGKLADDRPRDWAARFYELVADMKARCDRRGIRLIFFAGPLASQYLDRADPTVYRSVSDVAEKIRSMGIEYYDYRTAFPDDKFRDSHHLLRRSAYEFTKKFYAEVLKLPVGK